MSEINRAAVRMNFNDGTQISAWESFTLRDTYTDPLGDLNFTVAPPREQVPDYLARLQKGSLVTVLANEVNQGTFLITSHQHQIGSFGSRISFSCKTVLVTARDGSADPRYSFSTKDDAPLGKVILDILGPYGFDQLLADDAANVSALTGRTIGSSQAALNPDTLKTNEAQTQESERAYQFVARLVTRRGVAIRVDVDGRLLLTVPNYEQEAAYQVVQDYDFSTPGDRFLADPPITIVDSNDDQYADCRVRGSSLDTRGRTQSAQPEAIVTAEELNPSRPAYVSTGGAAYKRLEILDKDARDIAQCTNVAKLALGIRALNAYQVIGEVDGFVSQTGRIWTVNTMARVVVRAAGLDEDMWLLERVLMQDRDGGQKTRLTFIPKGALVLGNAPG